VEKKNNFDILDRKIKKTDYKSIDINKIVDEESFIEFIKNMYVSRVLENINMSKNKYNIKYGWANHTLEDFLYAILNGYVSHKNQSQTLDEYTNPWSLIAYLLILGQMYE